MSTELEQAYSTARGVLADVTPDQLDLPTPCASWKVQDLIDHLIGVTRWTTDTITTGQGTNPPPPERIAGDYVAVYDDVTRPALAAFGAPGALEQTVQLPFGAFPGSMLLGLATTDAFVHSWDLGKATGQSTPLDPDLAAALLERARVAIPDSFHGPDGAAPFGPIVEVPDTAPTADQLAAFLGRTP